MDKEHQNKGIPTDPRNASRTQRLLAVPGVFLLAAGLYCAYKAWDVSLEAAVEGGSIALDNSKVVHWILAFMALLPAGCIALFRATSRKRAGISRVIGEWLLFAGFAACAAFGSTMAFSGLLELQEIAALEADGVPATGRVFFKRETRGKHHDPYYQEYVRFIAADGNEYTARGEGHDDLPYFHSPVGTVTYLPDKPAINQTMDCPKSRTQAWGIIGGSCFLLLLPLAFIIYGIITFIRHPRTFRERLAASISRTGKSMRGQKK